MEAAEQFVVAMNAFDGGAIAAMLATDFQFTIGTHVTDRDGFVASVATGPEADPYFRFEPEAFEGHASAVVVIGNQVYRWRESDEIAHSSAQELRLDFEDGLIVRAAVTPQLEQSTS